MVLPPPPAWQPLIILDRAVRTMVSRGPGRHRGSAETKPGGLMGPATESFSPEELITDV